MMALFYICMCLHMRSIVSASSSLCFDPGIQYSFRRGIIVPPTVYQRKHRKPEKLSMVVEELIQGFSKNSVARDHRKM